MRRYPIGVAGPGYPSMSGARGARASGLPAFALSSEAAAYAATFASPPSARHQYHIERMFRQMKRRLTAPEWAVMQGANSGAWILAENDGTAYRTNLFNPGVNNGVVVGTPTHTPGVGFSTNAAGSYLDTGIRLNQLAAADVTMAVETTTASTSTTSDIGAIDGSSNGMSLCCNTTAPTGRAMGAVVSGIGGALAVNYAAAGFLYVSRRGSTASMTGGVRGCDLTTHTSASAAISSANTIFIGKVNGSANVANRTLTFALVAGGALSENAIAHIYGAVRNYLDAVRDGMPVQYDAGFQPAAASYDAVVYGATLMGVAYAEQMARLGRTVCIVGGWRERHHGGMSTNGLSFTDFDNRAALGGLPRTYVDRAKTIMGTSGVNSSIFLSPIMRRVVRERLGATDIPTYWSDGVASVAFSSGRLSSFTTRDGRQFSAKYFLDASYEGDLLALCPGVAMVTGREAAGTGAEICNGYRTISTASGSDLHQAHVAGGSTLLKIDPFLTPGDTGSGLIAGVIPRPVRALGAADGETQAYNIRMPWALTNQRRPIPSTPPAGYVATDYEHLGRWLAAATAAGSNLTLEDIFNIDLVGLSSYDTNSDGGFGTDLWGSGTAYVAAASNADRLVVWRRIVARGLGIMYYLAHEADARVPAGLRTAILAYGLANYGQLDPWWDDDDIFVPFQVYVREYRRLVGDVVMNGNHCAENTTLPSDKSVAAISYAMDSHHVQAMAVLDDGPTDYIWNEGNFFTASGGADSTVMLPAEAMFPKAAECANVATAFSFSATHVAFGAIRMEFTATQAAQSAAIYHHLAIAGGDIAQQSVSWAAFKAISDAVPDTIKPVLVLPYTLSTTGRTAGDDLSLVVGITRVDGSSGSITAVGSGGALNANNATSGGAAYAGYDLGTPNQYIEATAAADATSGAGPLLVLWMTDHTNWIGLRWQGSSLEMVTNVAGTKTVVQTIGSTTILSGQVVRLTVSSGVARAYVGGVQKGTDYTIVGPSAGTKAGLVARNNVKTPWIASGVTWGPL
jgi:hypothetical protein